MSTLAYAPATELRQSRWGTVALWLGVVAVVLLVACLAWRQFVLIPAIQEFRAHLASSLRMGPARSFDHVGTYLWILGNATLLNVLLCIAAVACATVGLVVRRSLRRRAIVAIFLAMLPLLVYAAFYLRVL